MRALHYCCSLFLKVFAWQAEALLKLHKHDEAEAVLNGAPKFDTNASAKVFGAPVIGYILMIQAQVDMAAGRLATNFFSKFVLTGVLSLLEVKNEIEF